MRWLERSSRPGAASRKRALPPLPALALSLSDRVCPRDPLIDLILEVRAVAQCRLGLLDRDADILGRLLDRVAVLPNRPDDIRHAQPRHHKHRPPTGGTLPEADQWMLVLTEPLVDVALRQLGVLPRTAK